MTSLCMHALVSGKVQGVWYRGGTQKQALKLNVTGWAKNLNDGRVEVMLCGEAAAVYEVESWLKQGPPNAEVDSVESDIVPFQQFSGFQVL